MWRQAAAGSRRVARGVGCTKGTLARNGAQLSGARMPNDYVVYVNSCNSRDCLSVCKCIDMRTNWDVLSSILQLQSLTSVRQSTQGELTIAERVQVLECQEAHCKTALEGNDILITLKCFYSLLSPCCRACIVRDIPSKTRSSRSIHRAHLTAA